jgi:hypothetical protein
MMALPPRISTASGESPSDTRTVSGRSLFALDHADHDVAVVRRSGFAEPLRFRAGHGDRRIGVESEFFAPGRIAGAYHEPVVESLRISGDERLGCAGLSLSRLKS